MVPQQNEESFRFFFLSVDSAETLKCIQKRITMYNFPVNNALTSSFPVISGIVSLSPTVLTTPLL